ncbi:MAG: hypothetical protein RLZ62_348, partial [Bacteroidota bacterium]
SVLESLNCFGCKGGKCTESAAEACYQEQSFLCREVSAQLKTRKGAEYEACQSVGCERGPGESRLQRLHDQRDTPAADTAESAAKENEKEMLWHDTFVRTISGYSGEAVPGSDKKSPINRV